MEEQDEPGRSRDTSWQAPCGAAGVPDTGDTHPPAAEAQDAGSAGNDAPVAPAPEPAHTPLDPKASSSAKRPRTTPQHDPTEAPDSQPSPSGAAAAEEESGRDTKRRRLATEGSCPDGTDTQQAQQLGPSPTRGDLAIVVFRRGFSGAAPAATAAAAAAAAAKAAAADAAAAEEHAVAEACAEAPHNATPQVEWCPLLKGLTEPGSSCPEAGRWPLNLPTSANADLWLQYRSDSDIFNVGLVGDTSATAPKPIPVAAVDLLVASEWFRGLIGHRQQLAGSLRAGSLRALPLPLRVDAAALETLVRGLYEGELMLEPDNMEAVLRAADAMQMPAVVSAVQDYITDFVRSSEGDGADFCLSAFQLAEALGMDVWAKQIVVHVIGTAIHSCRQRDAMRAMLGSVQDAAEQVSLLRAGCWQRCGANTSELLVLQFIFWLHQRPGPHATHEQLLLRRLQRLRQLQRMESDEEQQPEPPAAADLLEHVAWGTLHRAELEALAHQASGMDADDALCRLLHRKLLPLLADPGRHKAPLGGHYMVMELDVDALEAVDNDNPNAVVKSDPFKVEGHEVYLRCWHKKDVGWGLYLAPVDKEDRLSAFAYSAAHFFLQHEYSSGRLIGLRQPYALASTTTGANLGMAGQVSKFLSQYGEQGAVHQSSDGKRTIHVGVMVRALDTEKRLEQEKLQKEQQQQRLAAAADVALL